jgi:hypothetical protein
VHGQDDLSETPTGHRYERARDAAKRSARIGRMKKRLLLAVLWFYAFWYLGAVVAGALRISGLLGLVLGLCAAALIWTDPRRILWRPGSADRKQA